MCGEDRSADFSNRINSMRYLIQNRTILVVLFLISGLRLCAQGFLKTDGQKIVNEKGENVLLRGAGLGGWMLQEGYMLRVYKQAQQHRIRRRLEKLTSPQQVQEFYDTWLKNYIRKIDIDSMHAWGFNSVRLPMHYDLYTLPVEKEPVKNENTWLDKGFAMTDSLLSWCKANKMYLILDLHAAPGGQGNDLNISDRDTSRPSLWDSEANKQKTIALWKKLAQRYANEKWIGGYDILNEPNWGFEDPVNDKNGLKEPKNVPLKQLMVDITKAIREVDQHHIIIIEGNGWGNNYNGMLPTWDKNMVLSFHKYWNKNTENELRRMLDARKKYNVPIWIGETGENSNTWYTEAIQLFEENNIGWAWWPLKKAGSNNPLEVFANHNWMAVARYLNGQGEAPKESDVYSGMMELAVYSKLENCTYHRDVIDAMFRQTKTTATLPFKKITVRNSSVINAVDYDLGRNGYAYYDRDTANYGHGSTGNRGHTYRNDGVDIRKDSSHYEKYFVSDIEDGEWLQYTFDMSAAGNYSIELSVPTQKNDGNINLTLNSKTVAENISVPSSGKITIKNVAFKKGANKLRVLVNNGGFDFQTITITR
jgi:aryl-phospho-beta-D-glucosidase BglC (GH1 family)